MKKKHTILVVDDIRVNVELLKMRLEKDAYNVVCAFNGNQALEAVSRENPDLILLDVIMPGIDGYEVCRRVKSNPATRNIQVVMITSLSGTKDRIKGLEAGCDDFLSKPINEFELKVRVRSLLKLKSYTDELAIKNLIYQKEIQLAAAVQQKILPQQVPDIKGFDVDFVYIPCFSVGGDFFYFKSFSDDKLFVSVFDVVGHGIQAALITMILKTLIDTEAANIYEPDEFLSVINHQLIGIIGGKLTYVTATAAFFDLTQGSIKHSSAGHPPAFLCRSDNELIELKGKGHIMGLFEDAVFPSVSDSIYPGDHILLYTDGAFEAENEGLEIFGDKKLKQILLNNYMLSSSEVNRKIIEEIKEFVGEKEFSDDINLISVKIKDSGN